MGIINSVDGATSGGILLEAVVVADLSSAVEAVAVTASSSLKNYVR